MKVFARLPTRPDPSVALAGDHEEAVRLVPERVTARRQRLVAEHVESLGTPDEAVRRALLAYTSYLGFATLARSAPGVLPAEEAVHAYVEMALTRSRAGHHLGAAAGEPSRFHASIVVRHDDHGAGSGVVLVSDQGLSSPWASSSIGRAADF